MKPLEWVGVVSVAAGFLTVAWSLMQPAPAPEVAAPEQRQADGSVVIERAPESPRQNPAHAVPKGAKVERVVQVKVQGPGLRRESIALDAGPTLECPPVTVDLSVVREATGSRRVIASSPDGRVLSGIDVPVESPPAPRHWAAGLSLDPIHQTPGVWIERAWSRARIGVEINQVADKSGGRGGEIRLRLGFEF